MKLIYDSSPVTFEQELNESTGQKKYVIKGIFSSPGEKNKNGRIYPTSIWESEVQKYQETMSSGASNSLLELNHPARTNVEMMEAVAKMRKLYMKDGKVMGEAVLLDNPKANQLKTLIDNGIKMSVSSRGVGSVVENVVKDYRLITFDVIPDQGQSDHNAEMMGITEGILTESNYEVDDQGNISKVCTEDGVCHMFEDTEIKDAIETQFKNILSTLNEVEKMRTNLGGVYSITKVKIAQKIADSIDMSNSRIIAGIILDWCKANKVKVELLKRYIDNGTLDKKVTKRVFMAKNPQKLSDSGKKVLSVINNINESKLTFNIFESQRM